MTWIRLYLGSRLAKLTSKLRLHTLTWFLAATLAIIQVSAAVLLAMKPKPSSTYKIASAPLGGSVVAVRFVSQARISEITKFLNAHEASVIGGPGTDGFYSLRIADTTLPRDELIKIVSQIAQEKVVEIAAPVY